MTSRDFAFWLQGYLELSVESVCKDTPRPAGELNSSQVECIRKHLNLVFKHEIDPSMGTPEHQTHLNDIHGGGLVRC